MSSPPAVVDHRPTPAQRGLLYVPRSLTALLFISLTLAILYFGRHFFVPFALAILLSFLLDPLVCLLRRWRMPRGPAVGLVMICTVAVLGATSVFVASQAVQLSRDLPTYQNTVRAKLRDLRHTITQRGVLEDASRMLDVVGDELDATRRALDAGHGPKPAPTRVQIDSAAPSSLQALANLVTPVLTPLAMTGVVLIFVLFILLERTELRDRVMRLVGGDLHRTTDAMNEAAHRVSRYLTMQLLVNTSFAVPMAVGLWIIGVPGALLWGVIAGVLRFVPYVGLFIASLFPLITAFAVDPGWGMLLWTAALIFSLEMIINSLVEPWLYGASTGLAPVAVLVSAAIWTALWGPIGLILATPLTVCLVVMGRHLPSLQYLDLLFGRDPVFDAPTRLYQRLLAGDFEEAIEMAAQQVREGSLTSFYDATAIPALRLVAMNHAHVASAEHRHRIGAGVQALIRDLREEHPGTAGDGAAPLLCIGARWEVDTMSADMLAHALAQDGVQARHLPPSSVSAEHIAHLDLEGVHTVCLTYFSGAPEAHARYVCRRLRRLRPDLHIVLALWNASPSLLMADAATALSADAIANSFGEAVQRVKALMLPAGAADVMPAPRPDNEAERLLALAASGALQPAMREPFDRAAQRVADIFDTPMAMVSLIDHTSQFWQGAAGVQDTAESRTGARDSSICAHVVAGDAPLLVPDLARDPRFANNPALQAAGIRFYAGAPLRTAAGFTIGSLCILDHRPRSLTAREMRLLQAMADDLMKSLAAQPQPPAAVTEAAARRSRGLPPLAAATA